jgi:hypothetical protein
MRAFLIFLFTLSLWVPVHATDSGPGGKVVKVLPLWLDQQGRTATSPSLFDRDAYQFFLLNHTNDISAVRYDVLWSAAKNKADKLTVRVELRGVGEAGAPRLKNLEAEVTPGRFRQWTSLTLGGVDFKQFGAVVAWRATLWNGSELLGEQKSFLW